MYSYLLHKYKKDKERDTVTAGGGGQCGPKEDDRIKSGGHLLIYSLYGFRAFLSKFLCIGIQQSLYLRLGITSVQGSQLHTKVNNIPHLSESTPFIAYGNKTFASKIVISKVRSISKKRYCGRH
jgi:hypothetical protein